MALSIEWRIYRKELVINRSWQPTDVCHESPDTHTAKQTLRRALSLMLTQRQTTPEQAVRISRRFVFTRLSVCETDFSSARFVFTTKLAT
jgi:hypothetical protein